MPFTQFTIDRASTQARGPSPSAAVVVSQLMAVV